MNKQPQSLSKKSLSDEVSSLKLTKQNLRKIVSQILNQSIGTDENTKIIKLQLISHLTSFLKEQKGRWGAFKAIKNEASPFEAIESNPHIQWAYPRVSHDQLEFFLSPQFWKVSSLKIEEPDPEGCEPIKTVDLDGFLIPGLAFDFQGGRLGRGLGFYDRALKETKGLKVGVAWDCQMMKDPLPSEIFDISMDVIITNQGIVYNSINQNGRRRQK